MREPLLIVIAAPSGGGKSTVLKRVFAEVPGLLFSISHTTRPPRKGEVDGREYFFVDPPQFRGLIAEDAFLEWAEVHRNLYGTSRAELIPRALTGRTWSSTSMFRAPSRCCAPIPRPSPSF